ncbi:MAG: ATP-dependent helicase HrpB, partial [Bacteroidales bacterium]|nr:ATP-dependent helicase HrpB [Candidatus Cryptobacteroides equifaecalis]
MLDLAARLNRTIEQSARIVVTAPPGTGKSTVLPLEILKGLRQSQNIPEGKILMLEPRRIAARQIAERLSRNLGEKVGETVGYRVRLESKVSAKTRLEVLTEGILSRMLIDDPTLEGVSVLIFDEFHERSLVCEQALAMALETQRQLRPELRIIIMSATIDAGPVCTALDAPLLEGKGSMFPVETIWSRDVPDPRDIAERVARCVLEAHRAHEGDVLAFLPGEAEIRRCAELLKDSLGPTRLYPLYGMLPFDQQRAAIAPSAPGTRKVVLATPVAETSLTIEGVRVVVDSGLCRRMVYNQQTGLSRLETVRISQDMADQRRGRAGRVAPGVCYRLWNAAAERQMAPSRTPEILEADLAPLVLDVAAWGGTDASQLPWLTPPPGTSLSSARSLLEMLGALDSKGITPLGQKLSALPCHPRIARMLLSSADVGAPAAMAADMAALLEEKDPLAASAQGCELALRLEELCRVRNSGRPGNALWQRIIRTSDQYMRLLRAKLGVSVDAGADYVVDPYQVGTLLAGAFPERIGRLRDLGRREYLLSSGDPVAFDSADSLLSCEWIVAPDVSVRPGAVGRIFIAEALEPSMIEGLARSVDNVSWDSRSGSVLARKELRIGRLVLSSAELHDVGSDELTAVVAAAAQKEGLSMFDFNDEVLALQRRVASVAAWHPELELPDISTTAVLSRAGEWLPVFAPGVRTAAALKRVDMRAVIWSLLDYGQQQTVDRLAPSHAVLPGGKRFRLEYRQGAEAPVLRVRLQECFGMTDGPRVDDGRLPVLMEL